MMSAFSTATGETATGETATGETATGQTATGEKAAGATVGGAVRRAAPSLSRALRLWLYRWLRRERLGRQARRPLIERLADPRDDMLLALLQEGGAGLAVLDPNARIVRAHALDALFGDGATAGRSFVDLLPAAQREAAEERLASGSLARLTVELAETTRREPRVVEIGMAPVREADGGVSGRLVRLRDVTELHRLQAQLAHSQRLQAVGQLAGGVAHDFNNLLTTIIGAADEVLLDAALSTAAGQDVQQIRQSALSGAALVRQLLAFGRQQTLQPVRLAVNDEVERLCGLLRRTLGTAVTLCLELDRTARAIDIDLSQFERVLVNLAVNARDAMPQGGRLVLRTGSVVVADGLDRLAAPGAAVWGAAAWGGVPGEAIAAGRYVAIDVEDDGVGMASATLERIFDPFFTTRRDQGGNGLGLSTVLGVIRQSGGFIDVRSALDEGTCVRIHLPEAAAADGCATAPDAPEAAPAAARDGPVSPAAAAETERRVLLVEDEASVRLLAERVLRRRGWCVTAAESGDAALAGLAPGQIFDLVVSDVVMPGISGPELVRRLRGERPGLRAVLVSGYAEAASHADLTGDATTFVPKPYSLADLMQVMETLVARRPAADSDSAEAA